MGKYGEGPGEFKRPQGLALKGDRLYVADAANHRVQIFTLDGTFLKAWNELLYPYSVSIDVDGTVLVAEYGRHCITRFRPDGSLLGRAGVAGAAPGELNTPWDVVASEHGVFVVDSGNHRVQLWTAERWGRP